MTSCSECGFVYEELDRSAIAARLRLSPPDYRQVLLGVSDGVALLRPTPQVWSALEYVCHVRDVLLVQRDRAVLARVEDRPSFARMYREERMALCHYGEQALGEVLDELAVAARLCALVFDGLQDADWSRPLIYNWPEPAEFDLAWLGRHTVHEVEHHFRDVVSVMTRVTTSG